MTTTVFRTVRFKVKHLELAQACRAQCLAAKNLKNLGLFIVRNILSCFSSDSQRLKTDLNEHQVEVLDYVNRSIEIINARRRLKNDLKSTQLAELTRQRDAGTLSPDDFNEHSKACKPGKLFKRLDALAASRDAWQILDDSLLDQALRYRTDHVQETPFKALPAKASEQVRKQIGAEFKAWTASLASFKRPGAAHTGRPRMPGYLAQDALSVVKYFAGVLGSASLPTIEGRALYLDYGREQPLPASAFEAYRDFDWAAAQAMLVRQLPAAKRASARLVELRIVPKGPATTARFFLEGVFECAIEHPAGCVLAHFTHLAQAGQIKPDKLQSFYLQHLAHVDPSVPVAGADPGLNNLLALSFSHGPQGVIISNARLERKIGVFDAKIDALKAALASPRLRALQARQDPLQAESAAVAAAAAASPAASPGQATPAPRLSKAEVIELRTLQRAVYSAPALQALLEDRRQWLKNALHTASKGVVELLVEKGVQVLVVGKNKGWKTEADMGRAGNRRFHATAHAQLIEQLRYKCEDASILLVETEESYTSKTSFAANEPLQHFKDKQHAKEKAAKVTPAFPHSAGLAPSLPMPDPRASEGARVLQPQRCGTRRPAPGARTPARHAFVSQSPHGRPLGRWTSIHADLNGAYNIIRKVMPAFRVNDRLSSRFELWWLSPTGLRPFRPIISLNRRWAAGEVRGTRAAVSDHHAGPHLFAANAQVIS